MLNRFRYFLPAFALLIAVFGVSAGNAISGSDRGPAIGGYDPVAYFTDGKPVRGAPEIHTEWQGANWYFVSAEHRDEFLKNPEKYAPQYGGYCAYAAAHGSVAKGDGAYWKIVGDKLYLNNNWFAQKLWQVDVPGNLENSNQKWPQVKAKIDAREN